MAEPTDDVIYKIHATAVSTEGETTQAEQDDSFGTPDDLLRPPENLAALQLWTGFSGTRRACLDATVTNTVGLGYEITVARGHERELQDPEQEAVQIRAELEALCARDRRLEQPSFTAMMKAVIRDKHEVGQGYIEVARDRTTGRISGLFYVPAVNVRRRRDRKGYVLLRNDSLDSKDGTRFYNFGDKVKTRRDGTPINRTLPGRQWDTNELLVFRNYSSESRDYGLPVDTSVALEYLGDKLAAEANVGFFDASGAPPTVLFVAGEERKDGNTVHVSVPAETAGRIAATLRSGTNRANRVAVVPIPPGTKAEKVELGHVSDRDIGYVDFRTDMSERIRSTWRMPAIFTQGAGDSRYGAEVERAIAKEQLFDPEQTELEDRLAMTVVRDLGYGHRRLTFRDLAVEDDAARREGATRLAEAASITRRDYRQAYGAAPYPEAAQSETTITWAGREYQSEPPAPGQVPHGWNDEIVDIGVPGQQQGTLPGQDQRGLQPGLGGRVDRGGSGGRLNQVSAAAASAQRQLASATRGTTSRSAQRATARALAALGD